MNLTDPVADMLTRIRNACSAGHRRVDIPVSKLKTEVARLLRDNHYIADYKLLDDGQHGVLRLYLKYHNESPVIREQMIFPEIDYDKVEKIHGMDITIVTSTDRDDLAMGLLRELGWPFRGETPQKVA